MRKYEKEPIWKIIEKICDKCGKHSHIDEDPFEFQEFLTWEHDCGYDSIFGDGSGIELDLCQDCVKELLSPYMRVTRI